MVSNHFEPEADYWQRQSLTTVLEESCAAFLVIKAADERWEGPILAWEVLRSRTGCVEEPVQYLAVGTVSHGSVRNLSGTNYEEQSDTPIYELADNLLLRFVSGDDAVSVDTTEVMVRPDGRVDWLDDSNWPPSESSEVTWYLEPNGESGTLSSAPPAINMVSSFDYDPSATDACSTTAYPERLLWMSGPIAEDQVLVGAPRLVVQASISAVDTEFYAEFWSYSTSEEWFLISNGGTRVSVRDGIPPTEVEPYEVFELQIDMMPIAMEIEAGSILVLTLQSSSCALAEHPNLGLDTWASAQETISATNTISSGPEVPSYLEYSVVVP